MMDCQSGVLGSRPSVSTLLLLFFQSCHSLCVLMDCSRPGFPVLHYLPEFAQTHDHWVDDPIHSLITALSCCLQFFPASESFLMIQLFTSCGQSVGASVSASILPMNIQGWWICSCCPRDSQESSPNHSLKISVLQCSVFFMVHFSHLYMTTEKQ